MNPITLLQEAIVIGFFVYIINKIVSIYIKKPEYLPFIAGALTHVIWEIFGLNQWYCNNKLKLRGS